VKQGNGSLASASPWNKPSVKARAIATAVALSIAVVMAFVLSSCSSSVEHDLHGVVGEPPKVVVVEPSKVLELPTETDPRLVLEGAEERLATGDFVTADPDWEAADPHAPEGFLLKVEDAVIADGVTTVDVEAASLFEAEPEGTLNMVDESFSPVESSTVEDSAPVFALARASATSGSEEPDPVGKTNRSFVERLACGASGSIGVKTDVKTSLKPHVILEWSRRGRFRVGVDYAAAWVKGEATASVTARTSGLLRCEPDPIELARPSWRTVVLVGHVPVPVTVGLPIELSASARANGEVSITASVNSAATIGVSRRDGKTERAGKFVAPELVSSFEPELIRIGTAEATVFPAVSVEAGWKAPGLGKLAAVATLGVRGGVHIGYAAREEPPTRACVPVKVEASLSVHLPLQNTLGPWTVTPYKRNLRCYPRDPKSEGKGEAG